MLYIFLLYFKAFLEPWLLYYLWKMRGKSHFSFKIPIGLAKICSLPIVITSTKIPLSILKTFFLPRGLYQKFVGLSLTFGWYLFLFSRCRTCPSLCRPDCGNDSISCQKNVELREFDDVCGTSFDVHWACLWARMQSGTTSPGRLATWRKYHIPGRITDVL